jgi:gas vesicle protein
MSTSSTGKFILGALLGGALGALIGMLLAPRSGVETREMIRDEVANRYYTSKDNLSKRTDELRERATDKATAIRDRVREIAEDLEETGRRTVSQVRGGKKSESATTES